MYLTVLPSGTQVSTLAISMRERIHQIQYWISNILSLLHSLKNEFFPRQKCLPPGTHKPIQQSTINKCSYDHEHICHQKTNPTFTHLQEQQQIQYPSPHTWPPSPSDSTAAASSSMTWPPTVAMLLLGKLIYLPRWNFSWCFNRANRDLKCSSQ